MSNKEFTCFFWNNGSCNKTESECKFAHEITGTVANGPHGYRDYSAMPQTESCPSEPDSSPMRLQLELSTCPTTTSPTCRFDRSESDEVYWNHASHDCFNPTPVTWALQEEQRFERIKDYLASFKVDNMRELLDGTTFGAASIFYAVKKNSTRLVQLLLEIGVSPERQPWERPSPYCFDSTDIVTTLLAFGADPNSVPADMFQDFMKQPAAEMPDSVKSSAVQKEKLAWCDSTYRKALESAFNLSQRYYFRKASFQRKPSGREGQYASHHRLTSIYKLPYHIVDQEHAVNRFTEEILTHRVMDDPSPLALIFAGPSGHGKTEVARNMGTFLNVPLEIVDCTEMQYETDLFGPKAPHHGCEEGSRSNNFLCGHHGKPSVVFLDEFEKTKSESWNALSLPLDDGKSDFQRCALILNDKEAMFWSKTGLNINKAWWHYEEL